MYTMANDELYPNGRKTMIKKLFQTNLKEKVTLLVVILWAIISFAYQTLDWDFLPFTVTNTILIIFFCLLLLLIAIVILIIHLVQKRQLDRIDGTCLGCKHGVSFEDGPTFCRYYGECSSSNKCKKYEPIIPIKK